MMRPTPQLPASIGHVFQIAFVTPDDGKAVEYWSNKLGAGPFFEMPDQPLKSSHYRGRSFTDLRLKTFMGYWNEIVVEIMSPVNDTPSIFSDWIKAGHTGVHHMAVMVDRFDESCHIMADSGFELVQEGSIGDLAKMAFFDTLATGVPYLELVYLAPTARGVFEFMRNAAGSWDGKTDPLRKMPI